MAIEYTEEKRFTVEQVEALFKSVGWGIGAVARTVVQGIAAFGYGNQRMGMAAIWSAWFACSTIREGAKVAECADRGQRT